MNWALPGLMDPGHPKSDERLICDWDRALTLDFLTVDESAPVLGVDWWVSFQGQGARVGRQQGAVSVHDRVEHGLRTYYLFLNARSLPPGTHRFEFIPAGHPAIVRHVTVPATLANTVRPFQVSGAGDLSDTFVNRLLVWNPDTNSFYVLGVDGDPAQITVEPA
jgi:hypothetical protein